MKEYIIAALAALSLLPCASFAYGPLGHEIVGAIADERLTNTPTGEQVSALLDGITLEKASVIPDEIKGWDKRGADDPKIFHYSAHPKIDTQLRDFWRANQPTHDMNSAMPSHHWFHYADVPVMRAEKYGDGKAGRSKWDVVHMISYCVEVLRGHFPEENERKITKSMAVILLAHYVGDIHQPLHVGAEYFDQQGHITDPDRATSSLQDEGGNTMSLRLEGDPPRGRLPHTKSLHGFWDLDTVNGLLPALPEKMPKQERRALTDPAKKALAHEMATHEPKDWRAPTNLDVKDYAEAWANEIIPIAREAHERLSFKDVKPLQQEDRVVAAGEADETAAPDHVTYRDWAGKIVRTELHKAGWRLADLLEKAVGDAGTKRAATK
jgi:S1/P1 Nuclease